jgi:HlyD family secretion protein
MKSSVRRILPWVLWGGVAAVAVPLAWTQAGVGASPALIQGRVAKLAAPRSRERVRVQKILVKPGQAVKAGQTLIQMDSSHIDAEIAMARAKLDYVEIDSHWRSVRVRDSHALASHELASTAERSAVEAARIVAEAERDRSALTEIDVNLALEQKLVGDQLADSERLKALRVERAALAKKVEEYRGAVAKVRQQSTGSNRRLGVWKGTEKTSSETSAPDLAKLAAEVQRQEIKLLEIFRSNLEVRAPFDGVVAEVFAVEGEFSADPGEPLISVAEDRSTQAVVYVNQGRAERVHVGDNVKIIPRESAGATLRGRVVALAPNLQEIPLRFRHIPTVQEYARSVYVQLDASSTLPGMACDAVFSRSDGVGR